MIRYTFHKAERLKKRKLIEQLFAQGHSFSLFSFRVYYRILPLTNDAQQPYPAQVAFSVPRRYLRKAAQRNQLKRLMREAYRLQKHRLYIFLQAKQALLHWIIIYQSTEMITFERAHRQMAAVMEKLMQLPEWKNDHADAETDHS